MPNFDVIIGRAPAGSHVYACGPDTYMQAVMSAAEHAGIPEDARHLEYFSVPETTDYVNHAFTLKLAKTGREISEPPISPRPMPSRQRVSPSTSNARMASAASAAARS